MNLQPLEEHEKLDRPIMDRSSIIRYGALKLAVLIIFFTVNASFAREPIRSFDCMVDRVVDGDTLHCAVKASGGTYVKLRLYGIDAPETSHGSKPGQPFGEQAAKALELKAPLKSVIRVDVLAIDRYKRLISLVYRDSRNINLEMVSDGWAWAYRKYLDRPHASEFIDAEEHAQKMRLGLWQQNIPQPPWEFRKTTRASYGSEMN